MSFPRQYARTRRFSLGAPRGFQVSKDGRRVVFLRSRHGTDPVSCMWQARRMPNEEWGEEVLIDPRELDAPEDLSAEERARRERARETGGGVVAYTGDTELHRIVCTLGGQPYLVDTRDPGGSARELPVATPAADPLLAPDGSALAYAHSGTVRLLEVDSGEDRTLVAAGRDEVTWGLADFIAAEEMGRFRGMWWSPDGATLLAARVDTAGVQHWHLADPAEPAQEPRTVPFPAAGTPNAEVTLWLLPRDGGPAVQVRWDADDLPYLAAVDWSGTRPLLLVQSRDQRRTLTLEADPGSGATTVLRRDSHPDWVELMPGSPRGTRRGLAHIAVHDDTRALFLDAEPVTPPGLHVRAVLDVDSGDDGESVLFAASGEPTEVEVWMLDGGGRLRRLSEPGGVNAGRLGGGTLLLQRRDLAHDGPRTTVVRDGRTEHTIAAHTEKPELPPANLTLLRGGPRELRTAVVLPSWHEPGTARLPVLMDPYGGPHAQRVLAAAGAYLTPRWFAEQGFAVVVADGRGTPARGVAWETAVSGDLAGPPLEDQVAALNAAAERFGDLDLDRVAIRGWSFGGFLAALAVLRRPERFHAALAGAPVTDWRLYDTHYTERYLGLPEDNPEAYARSSLLGDAPRLSRPLLLIHGLVDDNVFYAHTQKLSAALMAAARPHTVLPLSGVTHMASDEDVEESLLLLQVDFLRRALHIAE